MVNATKSVKKIDLKCFHVQVYFYMFIILYRIFLILNVPLNLIWLFKTILYLHVACTLFRNQLHPEVHMINVYEWEDSAK